MRRVSLIIFVFFLLLGGGCRFYARTSQPLNNLISSENVTKSHPIKVTNKSTNCLIIEESEVDLEEEYDNTNDIKPLNTEKKIFTSHGYSILFALNIFNNSLNNIKYLPQFSGQSNPLYITQRVLRI